MKTSSRLFKIASITSVVVLLLSIYAMKSEQKDYYIATRTMPPMLVNEEIEAGYKILGRFKLWNPHPRELTDADIDTIRTKLPQWLAENYPDVDIDISRIGRTELKSKLKYEFTLLHCGQTIEGDFYVLKLGTKNKQRNVYFEKGVILDLELNKGVDILAYPFYTDEWVEDYSNPTPFQPGDFW